MFLDGGNHRKSSHDANALQIRSTNACASLFLTLAVSVGAASRGAGGGGGRGGVGEKVGDPDSALAAVALGTNTGGWATDAASASDEGGSSRRFAAIFSGNQPLEALVAENYGASSAKAALRTSSKQTCPGEWPDPHDFFAHLKGDWHRLIEIE